MRIQSPGFDDQPRRRWWANAIRRRCGFRRRNQRRRHCKLYTTIGHNRARENFQRGRITSFMRPEYQGIGLNDRHLFTPKRAAVWPNAF